MPKTNRRLCSRCGLRFARVNNTRCSACSNRQAEHVRPEIQRPEKLVTTGCQIIDTVAILELPFGYTAAAPALATYPELREFSPEVREPSLWVREPSLWVGRYWFDLVRVKNLNCRVPILRDAATVPDWICEQRRELGFTDPDIMWYAVWDVFERNNGYADAEALLHSAFEATGDSKLAAECLDYTVNLMTELGVLSVEGKDFDLPLIRQTLAE